MVEYEGVQLAWQTQLNQHGVIQEFNDQMYEIIKCSSKVCPPELTSAMLWYMSRLMQGVRREGAGDTGYFVVERQLLVVLTFVPTHWDAWTCVIGYRAPCSRLLPDFADTLMSMISFRLFQGLCGDMVGFRL